MSAMLAESRSDQATAVVDVPSSDRKRVVIIGGGFAGLAAACALRHADVDVFLIDRRNHHIFQPLLYQVATAVLSPAEIAAPIRQLEVKQQKPERAAGGGHRRRRCFPHDRGVFPRPGRPHDCIRLSGGRDRHAPELLRGRGVRAACAGPEAPQRRRDHPSQKPGRGRMGRSDRGRRRTRPADDVRAGRRWSHWRGTRGFPGANGERDAEGQFPPHRSGKGQHYSARRRQAGSADLCRVAVLEGDSTAHEARGEVLARSQRRERRRAGVVAGGIRIHSATVLWTAGVAASPIARMLGTRTDRAGRALVDSFLKVVDAPGVFVVGDAASVMQNEHPVPGVAQAAIQEGRYVGRLIAKELKGQKFKRPFHYFHKGNMAVVGKNYAVLKRGWLRMSGSLMWLVWACVHVLALPQLQNRLRVQRQWLWSYFTGQRSSRLIPEPPREARSRSDH